MQATINGKRYDTDRCNELAKFGHYNNGNYSGTTYLVEAKNGKLLVWTHSNGQDLYLRDSLVSFDEAMVSIDDFDPVDEERLVKLGLIEII